MSAELLCCERTMPDLHDCKNGPRVGLTPRALRPEEAASGGQRAWKRMEAKRGSSHGGRAWAES